MNAHEPARRAFVRACTLDVAVRKPGNVSVHSPGHGMHAGLFIASAEAAAGPLCRRGARVGPRIEAAMRATWAVAGCNTNLGILLLCAPLARAAERLDHGASAEALRTALTEVLAELDRDDARAAYRAIALANPGGLGKVAEQDVRAEPDIDLRAAMALAAGRDSIAAQYRDGYPLVFETGLAALGATFRPSSAGSEADPADAAGVAAVQRAWLALLNAAPDSHIVRKRGAAVAAAVQREAGVWLARALAGAELDADPAFAAWDAALKADGINPGTSADLLVATLMAAGLSDLSRLPPRGPASIPRHPTADPPTDPTNRRPSGPN